MTLVPLDVLRFRHALSHAPECAVGHTTAAKAWEAIKDAANQAGGAVLHGGLGPGLCAALVSGRENSDTTQRLIAVLVHWLCSEHSPTRDQAIGVFGDADAGAATSVTRVPRARDFAFGLLRRDIAVTARMALQAETMRYLACVKMLAKVPETADGGT